MTGFVNAKREALVSILIAGPTQLPESIDAVIDTGYDGILCLPSTVIQRLGLVWSRQGFATLADGSVTVSDVFDTYIFWHNQAVKAPVESVETYPLIGMRLLNGFRLTIDVREGGAVTIVPLED